MKETIPEQIHALKTRITALGKLKTIHPAAHWSPQELIHRPTYIEVPLHQTNMLNKAKQAEAAAQRELDSELKLMRTYLATQAPAPLPEKKITRLFNKFYSDLAFETDNLNSLFDNYDPFVGETLMPITTASELKNFILEITRFDYDLRLALGRAQALISAIVTSLELYYPLVSTNPTRCGIIENKILLLDKLCKLIEQKHEQYTLCKSKVRQHIQTAQGNAEIQQNYKAMAIETKEARELKEKNKKSRQEALSLALKTKVIDGNSVWLAADLFDFAIKKMRAQQTILADRAKTNPRYVKASDIANKLCNDLQQLRRDYFDEGTIQDIDALKEAYEGLIRDARTELANHRGVNRYVVDALAYLNTRAGGCFAFFKGPKTHSERKLNGLLHDLNEIDFPNLKDNRPLQQVPSSPC
ncbi:hypothetical protein DIZ81_07120 [Legionella taurinensis]|uniref:Uncharacterized protein n=1 Tax=Legionella taurinensis TaxID=70611 RepID=A0A3A5L373_9GAMM|nr:hypothetical protein [Legionella taurinensis]MDX1837156.1 hypothetical protein [Legionella taurinensis]PUT40367.1 hypothetical protein DB744_07120 [Legionella taurinensis]PUT40542.1 hypothetical protein DB746_11720 [Legionella taurinensis]PUT42787.1 hypothetical protein DB743_12205 [Legionella taurinensis]PUT48428.1 hypothetical protein DB745_05520 [Legionella taurinensis]